MELLNCNNAKDEFRKRLNLTNDKWAEYPKNDYRYYLFINKEDKKAILFKYTRETYHTAEGGRSESINTESIKELMQHNADGFKTLICVCYDDGEIWTTNPMNFLIYGYKKESERGADDKERYILNWAGKDEQGRDLWKVLKK